MAFIRDCTGGEWGYDVMFNPIGTVNGEKRMATHAVFEFVEQGGES